MKYFDDLLEFAGGALTSSGPLAATFAPWGAAGVTLKALLERRNGFYAFEGALLVRASGAQGPPASLEAWNDPTQWLETYPAVADRNLLFFAEDALGFQFALDASGVVTFDPETGEIKLFAADLEGWAQELLAEPSLHTGFPLIRAWRTSHGELSRGRRLLARQPFVLGGEFTTSNLMDADEVYGMRARSALATLLADTPDGAQVVFRLDSGG
jgi:hypothetical protein